MGDNPIFTHEDDIGRDDKGGGHDDSTSKLPSTHQLPSTPAASTSGRHGAPGDLLSGQRQKLLEDRVTDLYTKIMNDTGYISNADHYDLFFERDGQLFIKEFKVGGETYMEKRITKKNGQFPTIGVLETNLGKGRMRAMGFDIPETPNKRARSRELAIDANVLINEGGRGDPGEIIEMKTIDNIGKVVHDVGIFADETSFTGFTQRELKELIPNFKPIRVTLKVWNMK